MRGTDWISMDWDDRWRTVIRNLRKMVRTGAQFVVAGVGQDLAPKVDAFDVNSLLDLCALFGAGCLTWFVTTMAAPPANRQVRPPTVPDAGGGGSSPPPPPPAPLPPPTP